MSKGTWRKTTLVFSYSNENKNLCEKHSSTAKYKFSRCLISAEVNYLINTVVKIILAETQN